MSKKATGAAKVTDINPNLAPNKQQRKEMRRHLLNERGLLIQPKASRFNNSRPDPVVTAEVCTNKKASRSAVRASKTLIPKQYLSKVSVPYNQLRDITRQRLLPWGGDGWSFCPIGIYQDVRAEYAAKENEIKAAVEDMIDNWDVMLDEIEAMGEAWLGDMFDRADFPSPDEFRRAWQVEIGVQQVQSSDIRVAMDEAAAKDLEDQITKTVVANASNAWTAAATALAEGVQHAAKILGDQAIEADPDNGVKGKRRAAVHETLLDNLQVQVDTALAMAETIDDPDLKKLATAVQRDLLQIPADTIRRNPAVRDKVAKKADALASKAQTEQVANEQRAEDWVDEMSDFTGFMSD